MTPLPKSHLPGRLPPQTLSMLITSVTTPINTMVLYVPERIRHTLMAHRCRALQQQPSPRTCLRRDSQEMAAQNRLLVTVLVFRALDLSANVENSGALQACRVRSRCIPAVPKTTLLSVTVRMMTRMRSCQSHQLGQVLRHWVNAARSQRRLVSYRFILRNGKYHSSD